MEGKFIILQKLNPTVFRKLKLKNKLLKHKRASITANPFTY